MFCKTAVSAAALSAIISTPLAASSGPSNFHSSFITTSPYPSDVKFTAGVVDRRVELREFAEQHEEPSPQRDLQHVGDHQRQHRDDQRPHCREQDMVARTLRRAP